MKDVEDRLVRELGEIADQAATSHDALAVIQSRASSYLDEEQEVVVMLAPEERPYRGPRWKVALALGAFAAMVLALFGVAVLSPRSDDIATVDSTISTEEPATVDPTIPTEEAAAVETTPSAIEAWTPPPVDGEWVQVAAGEPWGPALVGAIEALPGGGYVTVTPTSPGVEIAEQDGFEIPTVMWSPDGVEWFDGDPERAIGRPSRFLDDPLAVAGDRLAVVDGTEFPDHVALAIGDPRTASWDVVALGNTALEGGAAEVEEVSLAANDDEVLVLAGLAQQGEMTDVVTWVVDPTTGTWETSSIEVADGAIQVAWIDGRWMLFASEEIPEPVGDQLGRRTALWTSSDGLTWSQADLPMQVEFVPSAVGPIGVVAATCVGMAHHNEFWYSADGLEWDMISQFDPREPRCDEANAVGDYGFVIPGEDLEALQLLAPDGSRVYQMTAPFEDFVAAASSGDTLLVSTGEIFSGFWLYSPS